jgi:hypothetical protein
MRPATTAGRCVFQNCIIVALGWTALLVVSPRCNRALRRSVGGVITVRSIRVGLLALLVGVGLGHLCRSTHTATYAVPIGNDVANIDVSATGIAVDVPWWVDVPNFAPVPQGANGIVGGSAR